MHSRPLAGILFIPRAWLKALGAACISSPKLRLQIQLQKRRNWNCLQSANPSIETRLVKSVKNIG